jgi:5-methylcytosine-specific restriction endonuclease McrA
MRDGLQNQCKICKEKVNQAYVENNPAKRKNTVASYYANNREMILGKQAIYRAENPEKRRESVNRWDKAHPEQCRERQRRRRARKLSQLGEVSPGIEGILFERQSGLCYYCDSELPVYHLEHKLPLSRGGLHEDANLVLSCPTCNRCKGRKTEEEFMENR